MAGFFSRCELESFALPSILGVRKWGIASCCNFFKLTCVQGKALVICVLYEIQTGRAAAGVVPTNFSRS